MNLAVVIGPFIALNLLDKMSFSDLFILFSGIVTVAILCTALVRIPKGNDIRSAVFRLSFSNMFEKGAIRIATVGLFVSFCYSSVISFISVYAKSLGLIEASSYFFMVFAVTMMITRPFTGKLYDKVGPGVVIYPSIIILRRAFPACFYKQQCDAFAIRSCHRHRLRIYHTVPSDLGDPVFAASPERLCNSDLFYAV